MSSLVEPDPDVFVPTERLDLGGAGTRRRVLHHFLTLAGGDDADDFASLDITALHELDPAFEWLGSAHRIRLRLLGCHADRVGTRGKRFTIRGHALGQTG